MLIFGIEVPLGYTIGVVKLKLTNDFKLFFKFQPKMVSKPPNARLFIQDACHSFNTSDTRAHARDSSTTLLVADDRPYTGNDKNTHCAKCKWYYGTPRLPKHCRHVR